MDSLLGTLSSFKDTSSVLIALLIWVIWQSHIDSRKREDKIIENYSKLQLVVVEEFKSTSMKITDALVELKEAFQRKSEEDRALINKNMELIGEVKTTIERCTRAS